MKQPNIVLIVSDQHRGDWMQCAGSPIVHTPNMDRMARDGVRFAQTYCNSPLCVPSRMSMLTGRLPHNTGVFTNEDHLSADKPTFAHAMARAGYETVLCGRMHFNGADQRHGFAKRLVGDISPSYLGGPGTDYGSLSGTASQGLRSIHLAGPGNSPVIEYDRSVALAAEEFIKKRSQLSEEDRPLFMTVGFYGPHHPYVAPPDTYQQALEAMVQDSPLVRDQAPLHPWVQEWFRRLNASQLTDEQITEARMNYAGLVNQLDRLVGRILKSSKELPGDTWVAYVSDHGDMAGDRGMFWKRSLFEGAVRVPMIWFPLQQDQSTFKLAQGRVVDVPVSLVDLAPTLVGLTGAPALPHQDGVDLSGVLSEEIDTGLLKSLARRAVFTELAGSSDSAIRMVRKGTFKLVSYYGYSPVQLFDLESDPGEQTDLSTNPQYKEVYEELLQEIERDWNPEEILRSLEQMRLDQQYMAGWGKEVGMGRLELWDENQPL